MEYFEIELIDKWKVVCPKCKSEILNKNGKYRGRQRFICLDCGFSFTTYSKTILDSTKISQFQWKQLIDSLIKGYNLKKMEEITGVSYVSLSKIRINILEVLYDLNIFKKTIKKYYYDPFDKSSVFSNYEEGGEVFYHKYNDNAYIMFTKTKYNQFSTCVFSKQIFNETLININYKYVEFLNINSTDNEEIVLYYEKLIHYLKKFRGIKQDKLKYYTNFFDLLQIYNTTEILDIILKTISSTPKKRNH